MHIRTHPRNQPFCFFLRYWVLLVKYAIRKKIVIFIVCIYRHILIWRLNNDLQSNERKTQMKTDFVSTLEQKNYQYNIHSEKAWAFRLHWLLFKCENKCSLGPVLRDLFTIISIHEISFLNSCEMNEIRSWSLATWNVVRLLLDAVVFFLCVCVH